MNEEGQYSQQTFLTFLYQPKLLDSTGGFALARHFSVTLSCSLRMIRRLGIGSSLAKCTETLGASIEWMGESKQKPVIIDPNFGNKLCINYVCNIKAHSEFDYWQSERWNCLLFRFEKWHSHTQRHIKNTHP